MAAAAFGCAHQTPVNPEAKSSENREQILCLDPSAPLPSASEPSVAGNAAPATRLPESVF